MTVDEELTHLEDNLRRLKIEYDVFFGGGSKRPPTELEWRVQSSLKKHSDSQRLNFAQRFRFNAIQQKYAVYSDLWRKKVNIKEEGFRRPADALLAISGLREERRAKPSVKKPEGALKIDITDPKAEKDHVRSLFEALTREGNGGAPPTFEWFQTFVNKKTNEIRSKFNCQAVEYEVAVREGKAKLMARPKN